MIKEAEEQLRQERLEREKAEALYELRQVEMRVSSATKNVDDYEKAIIDLKAVLEKEEAAAARYRETGDYEAYKEELGLISGMFLTLSSGSGTYGMSNLSFNSGVGSWIAVNR